MTREELAEKVNELLIERATSETKVALHEKAMSLIDLYAESREIPPPPLKWDTDSQYGDEYTSVVAYVFGLKFAAWNTGGGYTSRVEKRGHWDDGYGIRRHESLKEAREALLAYWKEIWGKEMCP